MLSHYLPVFWTMHLRNVLNTVYQLSLECWRCCCSPTVMAMQHSFVCFETAQCSSEGEAGKLSDRYSKSIEISLKGWGLCLLDPSSSPSWRLWRPWRPDALPNRSSPLQRDVGDQQWSLRKGHRTHCTSRPMHHPTRTARCPDLVPWG